MKSEVMLFNPQIFHPGLSFHHQTVLTEVMPFVSEFNTKCMGICVWINCTTEYYHHTQ